MSNIKRIDRKSLEMIMDGEILKEHSVVIKFYGTHCHLCHSLAPVYRDISEEHENVLFYAYNMEHGGDELEAKYGFDGVPTICHVRTGGVNTRIKFVPDPKPPNEDMWYHEPQLRKYIEQYK